METIKFNAVKAKNITTGEETPIPAIEGAGANVYFEKIPSDGNMVLLRLHVNDQYLDFRSMDNEMFGANGRIELVYNNDNESTYVLAGDIAGREGNEINWLFNMLLGRNSDISGQPGQFRFIDGENVNATGDFVEDTAASRTPFIGIGKCTTISLNFSDSATIKSYAFYDQDFKFKSKTTWVPDTDISVPSGAKYVVIITDNDLGAQFDVFMVGDEMDTIYPVLYSCEDIIRLAKSASGGDVTKAYVDEQIANVNGALEQTNTNVSNLSTTKADKSEVVAADTQTNARIDNLINAVTVDSEVQDIRLATDGKIYSSAGLAVRSQFDKVNEGLLSANILKKYVTFPAFEIGDINKDSGQQQSATSQMRTYTTIFEENVYAIETDGTYVIKILSYSDADFSTFVGSEQVTVTGYLNITNYIKSRYVKFTARHTNYSNIKLNEEAGKIKLYKSTFSELFNGNLLTNCNYSNSNGQWQTNTYGYRQSFREYIPLSSFGGILSRYGYQYQIGLYDSAFNYLGYIPYKDGELFTVDLLEFYAVKKGYSVSYIAIMINARDTSYQLTSNDFGTNWYCFAPNEDYTKYADSMLFDSGYTYSGVPIDLGRNNVSYVENWLNTGFPYGQDADCYEDYVIRFGSNGVVRLYDASIKERIGEYILTGALPHANSVSFSRVKYAESDDFPLLYVNTYGADGYDIGSCLVYRVTLNPFSVEVVQTIKIGFTNDSLWTTGNDDRPYGNFVVDTDRNMLIVYTTLDGDVKKTRIFEFSMPTLEDGETVVLNKNNIANYYDVNRQKYPQGCCYYKGKLYMMSGFGDTNPNGNPAYISVVDLGTRNTVSFINMNAIGLAIEPECIYIHRNRLAGGYLQSYLFNFN